MAKKTNFIDETIESVTEQEADTAIVEEPVMAVVINCTRLNVRKAGNLNSEILTVIENGEKVTVIKQNKDWTKIEINGVTGFVMNGYISIV